MFARSSENINIIATKIVGPSALPQDPPIEANSRQSGRELESEVGEVGHVLDLCAVSCNRGPRTTIRSLSEVGGLKFGINFGEVELVLDKLTREFNLERELGFSSGFRGSRVIVTPKPDEADEFSDSPQNMWSLGHSSCNAKPNSKPKDAQLGANTASRSAMTANR